MVPEELVLDGARPADVYVCHAMPGNTFATPWDADPRSNPEFTADELVEALSRPGIAGADLILCGHTHQPLVQRTRLPNRRTALVIRCSGGSAGGAPQTWYIGYALLTQRAKTASSYLEWEVTVAVAPYQPRDPSWTWDQPARRTLQ